MSRPVALVLRALGLGDFLTGLPALQLLRSARPDHELVLAAPTVLAPLIPLARAIDRLQPTEELMPVDAAYNGVELAVDLHGKGPASRRLLSDLQPGRVIGFADSAAGLAGPTWRADEHEVERWCRLVSESLQLGECRLPGVAGTLSVPAVDVPAGLTVVHPGAASVSRRWPAERFATVARALRGRGHQVVITGGDAERSLARTVSQASGAPTMVGLSLLQLFALVASARLVVCGDTGTAHIASSYRTPSVLLFGPVSPASWGPPTHRRHRVLFHGDGRGDPHGDQPDPSLLQITVPEVLDEVDRVDTADDGWHVSGSGQRQDLPC